MEKHDRSQAEINNVSGASGEIDLGQLIIDFTKQWKLIVAILLCGTLVVGIVVFQIPKVYQPSAIITQPSEAAIERLNRTSVLEIDQKNLFKLYFNMLRSELQLRQFITNNSYLKKLGLVSKDSSEEAAVARLLMSFQSTVLEPEPERPRANLVEFPSRVSLSIKHRDEAASVDLLNSYLKHINDQLVQKLKAQSLAISGERQEHLKSEIALLRSAAWYDLEQQIERRSRFNALEIEKLQNEKELLIELAKKNRQSQLARVREALIIAQKLGLENPTPLDDFNTSKGEIATSIKLGSQQELPLYLMGTRYLNALTETLKSRKDEEVSTKINELEKQIREIELDPELTALRNRESNDLYIDELPKLVSELNSLKSKTHDFGGIQAYQVEKQPVVTRMSVKPNRLTSIGLGFICSFAFAFFIAFLRIIVERKKGVN